MRPPDRETRSPDTVEGLVEEYRTRCLWFLEPGYVPATLEERLRVLAEIERHADLDGFRRAARLRQWLSRDSSARSAGS